MSTRLEKPSIALIGKQGAGKTAIALHLVKSHGYLHHSWAEGVRDVFQMAYGPIENYAEMKSRLFEVKSGGRLVTKSGRELLQQIGTEGMREQVDQDFWIKTGVLKIWRGQMVNDDTRFINEADALSRRGWLLVRVVASEPVRRDRIGEGFYGSDHSSEIEQDLIEEHVTLENEDRPVAETVKELMVKIHDLPKDWYLKGLDNAIEIL